MTEIQKVAGTAFVVAEFRNDENKEARPLYHDPFVRLFLDEESKKAADRISQSFPPIRNNVRLRTRYFDDQLRRRIDEGARQILILGAGLDTRPQRIAVENVAYFEIDAPETQAFKKARLEESAVDPNTNYIGADYVRDGMLHLLRQSGLDFSLPTHVIWEGNTMYLDDGAVRRILSDLMREMKRCSASFDYFAKDVIDNQTGDPEITAVVERFAAMGAPWTYGIDDLSALAAGCGAKVIDRVTLADLHRTFWPDQPLASPLYGYYSLCTVENAVDRL
ncbi:MAG: class I SAM-dependent methyltransferase [Alphaproteobacteria bacterium]|nr:class I SAM-dependent methyltransferase [Alphaproteobacteria bacterium]MBM3652308.1 class I SAM-dependent methyltransferase [Alphaproteobacteria bacterium]